MDTKVIFNGSCPICSREVDAYRRYAEGRGLPLTFSDLADEDLGRLGLTPEAAARRLHVLEDGVLLAGVPAFAALWKQMPRFRWLGQLVSLPVIRPLAGFVYEGVVAPALHALHRRRQRAGDSAARAR